MTTRKDKREYCIQAVENAMRLLREFRDGEDLGVTELARRLKLHKNNVFRVLATLEQHDYIEQNPSDGSYRLGVAALQLGQSYARAGDLMSRARPVLEQLSHETSETTHLAILRGHRVVHLEGVQSLRQVRRARRVAIGPVTAAELRRRGLPADGVARAPTEQAIAEALTALFDA